MDRLLAVPTEPVVDCLSDDEAAGFIAGGLSAPQRRRFADHLDACERCRRVVSALAAAACATSWEAAQGSDPGLHGGQMLGRFSLTRPLGDGAMGVVWAARDQELDRDVALKLLRLQPGGLGVEATVRLRREAQAMARLHHPNVVAVYELGAADDDRVFCAMELVDGVTLRGWLEAPRSWRDVIRVACAVGRGIEAAHAVGLIHRDIKPGNILIAADGRTLVSDFGLARLADLGAGDDDGDIADASLAPTSPIGSLTATGAVVGTPVYVAPEQLAGARADARTDQFSYCVTIYEALFGARPFSGPTIEDLWHDIRRGSPRRSHVGGVPARIMRCLERGLAAEPAARWPSMTALVGDLERAARRPRQRRIAALVAAAAAVAVAAGAIALFARESDPLDVARDATEQRIASAWNPLKAVVLQSRFVGTGSPLAHERATTTTNLLDAYRAAWRTQRIDAWSASHVRNEQTPEALERRLVCFDQLADAMDGLVALLLVPGVHDVEDAPQIVSRLEPIATCSNLDRLLARSIAPSTSMGMLAERQLRELEVVQIAGRHADVLTRARSLVDAATRAGETGLVARARFNLGWAQAKGGHLEEAESTLRTAVQEAAAVRDHYLVAESWLQLLDVTAFGLRHREAAAVIEPAARAAVAQAGNDPRQLADLAKILGLIAVAGGDFVAARTQFTEACDRRIAARGASDPAVANDESNLGALLTDLGHGDEATGHIERTIAIVRGAFGEHHPVIAQAEHNLSTIAGDRRDWAAAERHARAAVAMNITVRGADHPDVAGNRITLARALREQRRFVEARSELDLASATLARSFPANHPSRLVFDLRVAQVAEAEGHWDQAVEIDSRVLEATRRAGNPGSLRFALAELARLLADRKPRESLPLFDELARLNLDFKGRSVEHDAQVLTDLGNAALRAGRPAVAIRWFDRMPEGARTLSDLRRALDRASTGRRR